jgi:hypothetical protein
MRPECSEIAQNEQDEMGKGKKGTTRGVQSRTRLNPLTGELETVPGTKAGKKRTRLPVGHPLRTHDLYAESKTTKRPNRVANSDELE